MLITSSGVKQSLNKVNKHLLFSKSVRLLLTPAFSQQGIQALSFYNKTWIVSFNKNVKKKRSNLKLLLKRKESYNKMYKFI